MHQRDESGEWSAGAPRRVDRIVIVRLWADGPDRLDLRARVVEVDPDSTLERTSAHAGLDAIRNGVDAALERFAREAADDATGS